MKSRTDMLIKRLNEVSNSSFWPCYAISKDKSITGIISPKKSNEEKSPSLLQKYTVGKFGTREGKRRRKTGKTIEDRNFSGKSVNRNVEIDFPFVLRNECKSSFFNEKYLRGLKIVPRQQESTEKHERKTSIPQSRGIIYRGFSAPKKPIIGNHIEVQRTPKKTIIGNSIEIQTAISDEELEYLQHKNIFT